ncbi:MAG TPA: M20 family metallopeptidase [archaeon]|nr:M20 family metallopeptidase [archaeon]
MNSRIAEWRRQFHRIPELGTELPETAALVRKFFSELGVEVQESYQGIGVVGLIHGEKGEGPTVAVRADMDALEIKEQADREYGSRHPGRMHACGHDAHMAIALGAADFLARNKERFRGRLKLIFQPGEESMLGALRMVEAGALEKPKVDFLLGLHIGNIWEEVGLGQIGVCSKPVMAAADTFEFTIEAQGGHGAAPHTSPDPVLAASQAVIQLHTLIGRELDPVDPAVITVGQIQGGQAANIIPTAVRAKGTVRTLSEKVRDFLETRMAEVVSHTAAGYRCGHRFTYHRGSPVVKSDPEVTDLVAGSARELFGAGGVCRIEKPAMVGEDVSFFLREVPGCFFALGSSNPEKGFHSLHHSPLFDIDESVLWKGTAVFSLAALRLLEGSVSQAEQRGRLQS